MIETRLGKACRSLKNLAQNLAARESIEEVLGLTFMRHEDGVFHLQMKMKKAQLTQEQERIAWENAIPLGGKEP